LSGILNVDSAYVNHLGANTTTTQTLNVSGNTTLQNTSVTNLTSNNIVNSGAITSDSLHTRTITIH
jgi:hypothetical protein